MAAGMAALALVIDGFWVRVVKDERVGWGDNDEVEDKSGAEVDRKT